jgi:hypothetical protein
MYCEAPEPPPGFRAWQGEPLPARTKARAEGYSTSDALSLAGVAQDEVVEAVLLVARNLAGRGEQAQEQLAEVLGSHTVEIVLAFAARLDEP